MPNIKSQIKRDRTSEAARQKNSAEKNRARTAVKKVEAAVAAGNKEEALVALNAAISVLDQIAQAGVIAKNNADRKKAHLQHLVAGM